MLYIGSFSQHTNMSPSKHTNGIILAFQLRMPGHEWAPGGQETLIIISPIEAQLGIRCNLAAGRAHVRACARCRIVFQLNERVKRCQFEHAGRQYSSFRHIECILPAAMCNVGPSRFYNFKATPAPLAPPSPPPPPSPPTSAAHAGAQQAF